MACVCAARHVDRSAAANRGAGEQPGAPRSGAHPRTLRHCRPLTWIAGSTSGFPLQRLHPAPSLVIWQRPLPESQQRQGALAVAARTGLPAAHGVGRPSRAVPALRPQLTDQDLAALRLCHGVHTSCTSLADALRRLNPLRLVFENAIARIPAVQMAKHKAGPLRVLIANQNRGADQYKMMV